MQLAEAKARFIADWGRFGTDWGINRTIAQSTSCLWSADALSAEEVMEQLSISRGNANMNLRELMDWGLVQRVIVPGERKEFFSAEKDIWKVARQIIKAEKAPGTGSAVAVLKELSEVEGDKRDKAVKTFTDTIGNI